MGGVNRMENNYFQLLEDLSYNPYSILNMDVSKDEKKICLDSVYKKVMTKYLFSGSNVPFSTDTAANIYFSFWRWGNKYKHQQMMREMLKSTLHNRENLERHLIDCIFLMLYRPYIMTEAELNWKENTTNLYQFKKVGAGLWSLVNGNGYSNGYCDYEQMVYNNKAEQVRKWVLESILVFLFWLKELQALTQSIEYYMNWLEINGFAWINSRKINKNFLLYDFLATCLPEKLPTIGGKRLYYLYNHVDEFSDYYKSEYCNAEMIQQTIEAIKNNKKFQNNLNLTFAWRYED